MTTPEPIVVSVPHSGTRFLMERLGIKEHLHTTAEWESIKRRIANRKIIVPLREPSEVWRSWCRRADPKRTRHMGGFFLAWAVLQMVQELYDIDIICVDKCKDERITDWTEVGNEDKSRVGWQLIQTDLRCVYRLPIVAQHYGPDVESK